MGILGAALLVFTIFVRPQEFIPGLAALGILNLTTGLAVLGILVEFGMGKTKSAWTPQLPYLAAFAGWCFACTLVKAGTSEIGHTVNTVVFSSIFMLVTAYAARSLQRFAVMATLLVLIAVLLSSIGIQQSRGEFECILISAEDIATGDKTAGTTTGMSCVLSARDCSEQADKLDMVREKGSEFLCEKPGPFDTFSIAHGRVRWRGVLGDPNELALAIGAAFAFCFALHGFMKTKWRHALFALVLALAFYCIVQTQSRGGVLVFLGVIGVYFVRRYGLKGLIVGGAMGMPLLLLGGREGEEADSSTLERLGALYEGIDMFRASPIFGVGQGQFGEHYFITAHNSYLLAAAELGVPGMFLWSMLVYVSMKIPFQIAWGQNPGMDPRLKPFGSSLFVSFCGILIGITFLSFCYHAMLFIYFGLAGALYGAAKQTCSTFDVRIKVKEYAIVLGVDATLLVFLFIYTRIKGAP
jgi:O-Antigen ligase